MSAKGNPPSVGIVHGWTVEVLSLLFRYATPALVLLAAAGQVAWWIALVPVFPVWWSFLTSAHAASRRARIVRRPNRQISLDEAASEVRFRSASDALDFATAARAAALRALAEARTNGDREARQPGWWQRHRPGG